MKKYMAMGMVALGLLAACGNKPSQTQGNADSTKTTAPAVQNEEFAAFWTSFRNAVLAGDFATLKTRTVFPLQTRGPMDNQPIVTYGEGEFEKLFNLFLDSPTGLSTDFSETNRSYIRANPEIKFTADGRVPTMQKDGKTAAVTSMEFKLYADGWKLVFLYLEDDVYQKTGKEAV